MWSGERTCNTDIYRIQDLHREQFTKVTKVTPHRSAQLTVGKRQNTDDKEEGDDQDEPHPEVTVTVSIISAGSKGKLVSS